MGKGNGKTMILYTAQAKAMLVQFKCELLNPHWIFSIWLLFGLRAEGRGLQTAGSTRSKCWQGCLLPATSLPMTPLGFAHLQPLWLFASEYTCYAQHSSQADERNHMLLEWNADSRETRFCSQGQEGSTEPGIFVIHGKFVGRLPLA